jgi:hypothetical protein
MNFGIVHLSAIPLRSSASDKSEMVSQLLFGEMVEILEKKGKKWFKVRCLWDNYLGWVSSSQIQRITREEYENYHSHYAYSFELMQPAVTGSHFLPLTLGAVLRQYDGLQFQLNGNAYQFSGQVIHPEHQKSSTELLIKVARRYLFAPYLWGGRSPFGVDCSGFTQMVFKIAANFPLPRDAYQQVEQGELIDFFEQALPGDLIFFENTKGSIHHVGILIAEDRIIHASGQVRIDKLDHFGIFNEELKSYTHKLRVIKRVLPELHSPEEDTRGEKPESKASTQSISLAEGS